MKPEGITDFKGSYEDYLQGQGIGMSFAASRSNMPASVEKEKRRASVK
jgi:hypothetical protein